MTSHGSGFTEVTRLAAARDRLRAAVDEVERSDRVPVADADGRVLAETVTASRDVPGYDRAAMDGYAVRATDTHRASDRAPVTLTIRDDLAHDVGTEDAGASTSAAGGDADRGLDAGEAVPVHTGSPVPDGADAVLRVEVTERTDDSVTIFDAVAAGENVAPAGEDVEDGEDLFSAGRRLRPSDLALLKATGHAAVAVRDRPDVAVIPTGEELVDADPGRGEAIETNGLTVARLVERWGGTATKRDVVTDDADALADAIERDLDRDLVVTTGGSSVGERDLLPDVVEDLGEMLVHGVAIKPGHPVGFGVVEGTPVLTLPGYPVSCLVTALQLLRPAVATAAGYDPEPLPTQRATLERKIHSEPGVRSFVRVRFPDGRPGPADPVADDDLPSVEPLRTGGAGVLSSVTDADGWVVVPESVEGIPAGEDVSVQFWEALP